MAHAALDYEKLTSSDVIKRLNVDLKTGLAGAEAKQRLDTYGPNALKEKKVSPLAMFGKFTNL